MSELQRALHVLRTVLQYTNCLESQSDTSTGAADSAIHRDFVRTMTWRSVSSFRMQATSASFYGFPAATSRQ